MWSPWTTPPANIPTQQPPAYYGQVPMAPPLPTIQNPPLPPVNLQSCNNNYMPFQPPPINTTSAATPFIGPQLPIGSVAPTSIDTNLPISLYPPSNTQDPQYIWQQHYQQWQLYQQEYAKWHKQYGEQVSCKIFLPQTSILMMKVYNFSINVIWKLWLLQIIQAFTTINSNSNRNRRL